MNDQLRVKGTSLEDALNGNKLFPILFVRGKRDGICRAVLKISADCYVPRGYCQVLLCLSPGNYVKQIVRESGIEKAKTAEDILRVQK